MQKSIYLKVELDKYEWKYIRPSFTGICFLTSFQITSIHYDSFAFVLQKGYNEGFTDQKVFIIM